MRALLETHLPILIPSLMALFGVIVGSIISNLPEFFRERKNKRYEINKIVTKILELWFTYSAYDFEKHMKHFSDLFKNLPDDFQEKSF